MVSYNNSFHPIDLVLPDDFCEADSDDYSEDPLENASILEDDGMFRSRCGSLSDDLHEAGFFADESEALTTRGEVVLDELKCTQKASSANEGFCKRHSSSFSDSRRLIASSSSVYTSAESLISDGTDHDYDMLQMELANIPSDEDKLRYINGYVAYRQIEKRMESMSEEEREEHDYTCNRFKILDTQLFYTERSDKHFEESHAHEIMQGYADNDSIDYDKLAAETEHAVEFCFQEADAITPSEPARKEAELNFSSVSNTDCKDGEAKEQADEEGSATGSVARAIQGIAFRKYSRNAMSESTYGEGRMRSALDECPLALTDTIKHPMPIAVVDDANTISDVGDDDFVKDAMKEGLSSIRSGEDGPSESGSSNLATWNVSTKSSASTGIGGDDFVKQALHDCFSVASSNPAGSEWMTAAKREFHTDFMPAVGASISMPALSRKIRSPLRATVSYTMGANSIEYSNLLANEMARMKKSAVQPVDDILPPTDTLVDFSILNRSSGSEEEQARSNWSKSTGSTLTPSSSSVATLVAHNEEAAVEVCTAKPPINSADKIKVSHSDITQHEMSLISSEPKSQSATVFRNLDGNEASSISPTAGDEGLEHGTAMINPFALENVDRATAISGDNDKSLSYWDYGIVPIITITPPTPPLGEKSFFIGGRQTDEAMLSVDEVDIDEPLLSEMSSEYLIYPAITKPLQTYPFDAMGFDVIALLLKSEDFKSNRHVGILASVSQPVLGRHAITPPVQSFASLLNIKLSLSGSKPATRLPKQLRRKLMLYYSEPAMEYPAVTIKSFSSLKNMSKFSSSATTQASTSAVNRAAAKPGVHTTRSEPLVRYSAIPIKRFHSNMATNLKPSFLKEILPNILSLDPAQDCEKTVPTTAEVLPPVADMHFPSSFKVEQFSAFYLTLPEGRSDTIEYLERQIASGKRNHGDVQVVLVVKPKPTSTLSAEENCYPLEHKELGMKKTISESFLPRVKCRNEESCTPGKSVSVDSVHKPVEELLSVCQKLPNEMLSAVGKKISSVGENTPNDHQKLPVAVSQKLSDDKPLGESPSVGKISSSELPLKESANSLSTELESKKSDGLPSVEQDSVYSGESEEEYRRLVSASLARESGVLNPFIEFENRCIDSLERHLDAKSKCRAGLGQALEGEFSSVADCKDSVQSPKSSRPRTLTESSEGSDAKPSANGSRDSLRDEKSVSSSLPSLSASTMSKMATEIADIVTQEETKSPQSEEMMEDPNCSLNVELLSGKIKQSAEKLSSKSSVAMEDVYTLMADNATESSASVMSEKENVYALMVASDRGSSKLSLSSKAVSEPEDAYSLMHKGNMDSASSSVGDYSDSSVKLKNFFSRKKCVVISSPSLISDKGLKAESVKGSSCRGSSHMISSALRSSRSAAQSSVSSHSLEKSSTYSKLTVTSCSTSYSTGQVHDLSSRKIPTVKGSGSSILESLGSTLAGTGKARRWSHSGSSRMGYDQSGSSVGGYCSGNSVTGTMVMECVTSSNHSRGCANSMKRDSTLSYSQVSSRPSQSTHSAMSRPTSSAKDLDSCNGAIEHGESAVSGRSTTHTAASSLLSVASVPTKRSSRTAAVRSALAAKPPPLAKRNNRRTAPPAKSDANRKTPSLKRTSLSAKERSRDASRAATAHKRSAQVYESPQRTKKTSHFSPENRGSPQRKETAVKNYRSKDRDNKHIPRRTDVPAKSSPPREHGAKTTPRKTEVPEENSQLKEHESKRSRRKTEVRKSLSPAGRKVTSKTKQQPRASSSSRQNKGVAPPRGKNSGKPQSLSSLKRKEKNIAADDMYTCVKTSAKELETVKKRGNKLAITEHDEEVDFLRSKSTSSTPPPKIKATLQKKTGRTKSAPLSRSSNPLLHERSCSSAEFESATSQLSKPAKSTSAPSLPSSANLGEVFPSAPSKSSTRQINAAVKAAELKARMAALSPTSPATLNQRFSLFAVDSPLQCHPPPPTPVSSPDVLPTTSEGQSKYSDIDPMFQKYLKVSLV